MYCNSKIYNIPFNHSLQDLLWQFCMSLQTIFGKKDILCVTWFLSVLVIYFFVNSCSFYLYKKLNLKRELYLYFSDLFLLLLLLLLKITEDYIVNSRELYKSLTISIFMQIGYIFFIYKNNVVSHKKTFLMILFQMIFSAALYRNFGAAYVTANEFWAYQLIVTLVFWISFLYSDKMKSNFLEKTCDLSYVLYLLHGFLGFSIIQYLILKVGLSKSVSCIIACISVYYLSYVFHKHIEAPFHKLFGVSIFYKKNSNK